MSCQLRERHSELFHGKQPGLSTVTALGHIPGSQRGWDSFTCPRGDVLHALAVEMSHGFVWWHRRWQICSVFILGAARLPAVPELLRKEGRSCVGSSFSQAHSPREGSRRSLHGWAKCSSSNSE